VTDRRGGRVDLDRLAELEAERAFLLASLRDLEAEHDAGDLDDLDHATLRDGYTKRAADVLRQIEAGKATLAPKRPADWRRRIAGAAACVVVAVGLGWFVASSAGDRDATDEATDRPVAERDDTSALLAEARVLFSTGQFDGAAQRYQRVLDLDPANAEARTYLGWLLVKGAETADDATWEQATAAAELAFTAAIDGDATYADPHCFLAAIVAADDPDRAADELERCRALDPPADLAALADDVAAGLAALSSEPPSSSAP